MYKLGDDFVNFDDSHVDWDFILEDKNPASTCTAEKPKPCVVFQCPQCSKRYKSASGFRGHMKNIHQMFNVKVSQYKQTVDEPVSEPVPTENTTDQSSDQEAAQSHNKIHKGGLKNCISYDKSDLEQDIQMLMLKTCDKIGSDENFAFEGSVFGKTISDLGMSLAAVLKSGQKMENRVVEMLVNKLWETLSAGEDKKLLSSQSEDMWHTFFNVWVDDNLTQELIPCFKSLLTNEHDYEDLFRFTRVFLFQLESIVRVSCAKITKSPTTTTKATTLTSEEKEALRYFAGYVPYKLRKRLQKKEDSSSYMSLLDAMQEKAVTDGDISQSKGWLNAQDRGGLFRVTDAAFQFFTEIESVCKQHLNVTNVSNLTKNNAINQPIIEEILASEKINSLWCTIARNAESEKVSSTLATMIVNLYVQVRCFSFCKSIMELFKTREKLHIKGSKGLRKSLK
ncbi:uncharacterized protein [Ptychodera flava]|uniref:uncharacterized protein n=1 Tax=Ptychodera flava TaxID=63121 RepID=UPI00396A4499